MKSNSAWFSTRDHASATRHVFSEQLQSCTSDLRTLQFVHFGVAIHLPPWHPFTRYRASCCHGNLSSCAIPASPNPSSQYPQAYAMHLMRGNSAQNSSADVLLPPAQNNTSYRSLTSIAHRRTARHCRGARIQAWGRFMGQS